MTTIKKQPKSKRRWLRFGLRSFLIALTMFCVWLGWFLYRVEQQRNAVKWVRENRGEVFYDYQFDRKNNRFADSQPPVPNWLLNKLDINYFASVVYVSMLRNSGQISDMEPLAGLANLEILQFGNCRVSDLGPLAGLANLEDLLIACVPVSDLTPLSGLKNLKQLKLHGTQVSDVTPLAGLINLERLNLDQTQVSDVTPLAGLTNLKLLRLEFTPVNDLTPLARLKHLEHLRLRGSIQVSDLIPLAGLTNLESLSLTETQVNDEDIEKLQLALPNCRIRLD